MILSPLDTLGEICIFTKDGELLNRFIGHRRPISCITFHSDSNILASGSQDNDVILWDSSADSGICRFVGHQNEVTDLCFIPNSNYLISTSKDTHIRVWDIVLQTCIQTVTAICAEIYSICFLDENQIVFGGKSDDLFIYEISNSETILTLAESVQKHSKHKYKNYVRPTIIHF